MRTSMQSDTSVKRTQLLGNANHRSRKGRVSLSQQIPQIRGLSERSYKSRAISIALAAGGCYRLPVLLGATLGELGC